MYKFSVSGRAFEQPVLGEISLCFKQGETVCLLGPSGCGKTSLLNILAGLDKGYQDAAWQGAKPTVGYLFQQPRLLPWRTVLDNLLLVNPDKPRALVLLDAVGLADAANRFPAQLSLGMARRVALVRCLLLSPDVILMDEPLVSLDPAMTGQLRTLITRLVIEDPTKHLLYVTHDLDDAVQLGDRVMMLGGSPARITRTFKRDELSRTVLEKAY